ncbi:MAG: hypothetical protein JWM99_1564, partial [Verrucomicrobiales bacterium]|nr:hypothetical protein [Verrucomicrobiales bacterium]
LFRSFLNAVGGFFNRQSVRTNSASNTNDTNRTSVGSLVLDSLLSHPAQTNSMGTNTALLADRLGTFLGNEAPGTNSPSVSTNLVQKLRDWLQAQQSNGTNSSTNSATQRSWAALTNALAAHASTNSANSNTLTGTNLIQKLRDWVAREQQTQTNITNTNNAGSALNSLAALFNNATNQVATNVSSLAQTNATPAENLLRGLGNIFDRQQSNHK